MTKSSTQLEKQKVVGLTESKQSNAQARMIVEESVLTQLKEIEKDIKILPDHQLKLSWFISKECIVLLEQEMTHRGLTVIG